MRTLLAVWAFALISVAAPAVAEPTIYRMDTLGHQTAYVDVGKGEAIVLIHGLGADMTRFERNIGPLSRTHRVITPDLLGFGASDKPPLAYRGQVYVDQIRALLDGLDVETATLVGNSMGGWIAMLFAEQFPDRVERLVLLAPAFVQGMPPGLTADRLAKGVVPQTLEQMQRYLSRVLHGADWDDAATSSFLAYHADVNDNGAVPALARSIASGEDAFTNERLAALKTPTVIMHGASDGVVPLAASEALASRLPDATLVSIEDTGHWPQWEEPAAFHRLLLE